MNGESGPSGYFHKDSRRLDVKRKWCILLNMCLLLLVTVKLDDNGGRLHLQLPTMCMCVTNNRNFISFCRCTDCVVNTGRSVGSVEFNEGH